MIGTFRPPVVRSEHWQDPLRSRAISRQPFAVGRFVLVAAVAASLHGSSVVAQDAANQTVTQALAKAQADAEKLRTEKKLEEAVAVCERFFREHPDCGPAGRTLVYFVDGILWRDLEKDPETRKGIFTRGYQEFPNVPDYFALCARYLVQSYLWVDAPKAVEIAKEALAKLGDRLPDDYVGDSVLMFHMYALRNSSKFPEAVAAAREYAARSPRLLSHPDFQAAFFEAVRGGGKQEEIVSAAKTFYVLCDFTEEAINKATTFVSQALTAAEGPGVAIQFAKSQEDPKVKNPLKDVPVLSVGKAEEMLQAAGNDPEAKLNVLLCLGRIAEALTLAKDQMRKATDAGTLSTAMKNLARCFKAKDLNLIRANRFLEFHRTGEGDNPLKELEAELEKEAQR